MLAEAPHDLHQGMSKTIRGTIQSVYYYSSRPGIMMEIQFDDGETVTLSHAPPFSSSEVDPTFEYFDQLVHGGLVDAEVTGEAENRYFLWFKKVETPASRPVTQPTSGPASKPATQQK